MVFFDRRGEKMSVELAKKLGAAAVAACSDVQVQDSLDIDREIRVSIDVAIALAIEAARTGKLAAAYKKGRITLLQAMRRTQEGSSAPFVVLSAQQVSEFLEHVSRQYLLSLVETCVNTYHAETLLLPVDQCMLNPGQLPKVHLFFLDGAIIVAS